jgi:hypothetical protein
MVDILIEGDAATRHNLRFGTALTVQTTGNNFYQFYGADDFGFAYRKSEDRMVTWQPEVTIFAGGAVEMVKAVIWFDEQTDGITGEFIHIFYLGATPGNIREYRSLNTLTDVLSAPVSVGGGAVDSANNWSVHCISIVKTRAGNLYLGGWVDTGGGGDNWLLRSIDNGLTWTASGDLATMADGAAVDKIIFLPANLADPDDFWCVYLDRSVPELTVKTYDASADVWTESAVFAGAVVVDSSVYFQMAATVRHSDGHALIAIWTHINNAVADYRVIDWDGTTGTFLTNVRTNLNGAGVAAISIDQANDRIYCGYVVGTWELTVDVRYAVSPDNGVTWTDLPYSEDAADDLRWISCDISPPPGGNFMLAWQNEDLDDVLTNIVNRVQFEAPPAPPPPGVEEPGGGSSNRLLSGSAGGFLTYITPDGRLYPLHTPHDFGRWVISYSGFGTPPIQYITQRGPFQHGETVKDFFLRPRVIQLLIRQGFINRTAWWGGRASLLDEIRPNRQLTATAAVPGQLRLVQTDGTVRDLNVFISEGPRFEPRIPTQWDEHAFQEVLRFTAYDPVAFDPAEVTVAFAITLAAHLVFPITFPIQFGSGLIDDTQNVTYLGTWEEFPIITVVGPIKDFRLDNVTTGEKIEFSADIDPGRTVTIDLRPGFKTVVDDLGANLIGIVTSDSDLATWHLAPDPEVTNGVNALRLRGTNPTGGTSVTLRYFDRYFGF